MGIFNRKKKNTGGSPRPLQPGAAYLQGQRAYDNGDYDEAFTCYKKAAVEGDPAAFSGLGACYFQGRGVEKDIKKALLWYEKAAEQGNVQAQRETANIYAGAPDMALKNVERQAYWYEKAAGQGDAFSQYAIGNCYLEGVGVKKSVNCAKEWTLLSAEQGNVYGAFQLAYIYEGEGDREKYMTWLTRAAGQGLGVAQCRLGVEYMDGKYVEKDLEKALHWMEKAKENQVSLAVEAVERIKGMLAEEKCEKEFQEPDAGQLVSLGQNYYQEGDYKQAIPCIEKAAQMGHPSAQAMLGAWYAKGVDLQGQETKADLEKAQYWMEKAAAQGNSRAEEALRDITRVRAADLYNEGIEKITMRVVDQTLGTAVEDFSEAEPYLEKAGELGLVEAQVLLASHYLYGDCECISELRSAGIGLLWTGDIVDTEKGMYWLKKAVKQEDANAMFIYAKCLLWGPEHVDSMMDAFLETGSLDGSSQKNTKEAFDMAVRASDLGCFEAADWLSKAERNHYPGASEALRRTKSYREWEEKERKK